jgi:hypothetical protein
VPKRIYFYALKPDLLYVLSEMESKWSLKYTLYGASEKSEPKSWTSAADLPELGVADGSQHLTCRGYLVSDSLTDVRSYPVGLSSGTLRFDTDQLINPDTINFIPAGERNGGAIIAGGFATISDSSAAQFLMRLAVRMVKRHFTRVNAFWVGPEALIRFRAGTRLCYAEQSPPGYDLRETHPASNDLA